MMQLRKLRMVLSLMFSASWNACIRQRYPP